MRESINRNFYSFKNYIKQEKEKFSMPKDNGAVGVIIFIIGALFLVFAVPSLSKCTPFDVNICGAPLFSAFIGIVLIYFGAKAMA